MITAATSDHHQQLPTSRTAPTTRRLLLTQYGVGGARNANNNNSSSHQLSTSPIAQQTAEDNDEFGDLPASFASHRQQLQQFTDASTAALTHRLQRKNLPAKCYHCDAYTFFATVQCSEVS